MAKRGTKWVLEYARLAMGFANVRAGTRVLMLVLVQATSGEQGYWETAPCATAAGDMFLYCSVTKAGTATKPQLVVCGSVKGACALQHPHSVGNSRGDE